MTLNLRIFQTSAMILILFLLLRNVSGQVRAHRYYSTEYGLSHVFLPRGAKLVCALPFQYKLILSHSLSSRRLFSESFHTRSTNRRTDCWYIIQDNDQWADKLEGQTALITGSNVGLGFEATRELVQHKISRVILAVRSTENGETAKIKLQEKHPKCKIEVWELDQNSVESMTAFQ